METCQKYALVSLIPSPTSFLSVPKSAAVFLGPSYHLSEEIEWLQNMTSASLLTPTCSLLILFILFRQTRIRCWPSLSTSEALSQGARYLHCQEHVFGRLHGTTLFPLLNLLKNFSSLKC